MHILGGVTLDSIRDHPTRNTMLLSNKLDRCVEKGVLNVLCDASVCADNAFNSSFAKVLEIVTFYELLNMASSTPHSERTRRRQERSIISEYRSWLLSVLTVFRVIPRGRQNPALGTVPSIFIAVIYNKARGKLSETNYIPIKSSLGRDSHYLFYWNI